MTPALSIRPQCRVIVDNDWSGDPDGLVALAHHLLSPTNEVVLVSSSRLHDMFQYERSSPEAAALMAAELVDVVQPALTPRVVAGSASWFADGAGSPAADAIVEVALQDHPLPLVLVCAGPLTNVAQALDQEPGIQTRLSLVWVGGSLTDRDEYNRDADRAAADFVFAQPDLSISWFPVEAYRQVSVSVAELQHELGAGCGEVGRALWDAFVALPIPDGVHVGGTWVLGDSCPLLLTALSADTSSRESTSSPGIRAERTVFTSVDSRLLIADMWARFRLRDA